MKINFSPAVVGCSGSSIHLFDKHVFEHLQYAIHGTSHWETEMSRTGFLRM